MKATLRTILALSIALLPVASQATKIPLPIEGATMNVSFQLQTQMQYNENGGPSLLADGSSNSFDIFIRRSRLLVNGDISSNFSYLVQIDNPNYGKNSNFTGRAYVQDAWIGWAPMGNTGGTVLFIDAGILLIPISHHLLESTTNFTTADVHTDSFRGISATLFPGLRDTGVQVRGWLLDKKIGFRGGIYEGVRSTATSATDKDPLAPKSMPQFAGFVNLDIIGSEEGGWLYGAYKWGTAPILSVGFSALDQSKALRTALGRSDQELLAADVYFNMPVGGEESELVFEATVYKNSNGTGSNATGLGFFADLGYRYKWIAPYISVEAFNADTCDLTITGLTAANCTGATSRPGKAFDNVGTADSRNLRAGLNFFFNKNQNHLNIELGINDGQSSYGGQAITYATGGAPQNTDVTASATKSLLMHWNVIF